MYIYAYTYTCIQKQKSIYMQIWIYEYTYTQAYTCPCIYIYVYISTYIDMYVYEYIYAYVYLWKFSQVQECSNPGRQESDSVYLSVESHDAFMRDRIRSCVTRLIHAWHDSFIRDMAHLCYGLHDFFTFWRQKPRFIPCHSTYRVTWLFHIVWRGSFM